MNKCNVFTEEVDKLLIQNVDVLKSNLVKVSVALFKLKILLSFYKTLQSWKDSTLFICNAYLCNVNFHAKVCLIHVALVGSLYT